MNMLNLTNERIKETISLPATYWLDNISICTSSEKQKEYEGHYQDLMEAQEVLCNGFSDNKVVINLIVKLTGTKNRTLYYGEQYYEPVITMLQSVLD
jgi:hypothetical protein